MGMNLPYTGHLATDLAGLGFPPGNITEHDQAIGNWMTRTYRHDGVQVKVNEDNGEVTVARLVDNADTCDAYDVAWEVDFPREAETEAILAVVRTLHTLRRLADNSHPMPRRTITPVPALAPAPAALVLEADPAAVDMAREYQPVLDALADAGIPAALRSHGHDRWDIRTTSRAGHDITIDDNGRYLPPTLAQVTGWTLTRWAGPYLQDRQDIPTGNLPALANSVANQTVAAA